MCKIGLSPPQSFFLLLLTLVLLNKLWCHAHFWFSANQITWFWILILIHIQWQTVQIQISWLLQKPTDLDLHCLQRRGISGFSRTRVKCTVKLCWWQSQTEAFSAIKGDRNSKINNSILPVFGLIRDYIHAHLICKFKEVPIKTERIMLMTRSNIGVSAIKGR